MTPDEELAEMRRQYSQATAEAHMLAGGTVFLRCAKCRERPVPKGWSFMQLCDPCLQEKLAKTASPDRNTAPSPPTS